MLLIPFKINIPAGKHKVIALGNNFSEAEVLQIFKIDLTTSSPIEATLFSTNKRNILGGKDISNNIAVSDFTGTPALKSNSIALFDFKTTQDIFPIKHKLVSSESVLMDKEDGFSLRESMFIILQVSASVPTTIAGNILWRQPDEVNQ